MDKDGLEWRVAAMRRKVNRSEPAPFLTIKEGVGIRSSECISCGEEGNLSVTQRCVPCIEAARQVLDEVYCAPFKM